MPGPNAEQISIDQFLSGLTPSGLAYARSRIRAYTSSYDLTQLPTEIILLISEHLGTHDVLNIALVSKAWRHIWRQDTVSSAICRRMFPGFLEYHAQAAADPTAMLLQAISETRKVWPGQEDISTKRLKQHNLYWPTEYMNQRMGYSEMRDAKLNQGKFAWSTRSPNPAIHVHDLASGHVQHIGFGEATLIGEMVIFWDVSSKLVVAQQMSSSFSEAPSGVKKRTM
jgi:hypothetical protein